MQRISALALAACGALFGALSVTPVPAVALASAPAADCPAGGADLDVNKWIGPQVGGAWNKDENWSLGKHPRANSRNQLVCIRAAQVVMTEGLRVHVAAIDVGDAGELGVQSSNWLFLGAEPHQVRSMVAPGSRLEINGGVVGGRGRIVVEGKLVLSAKQSSHAVLTTRSCRSHCKTPLPARHWGAIRVKGDGLLLVRSAVRVADKYRVVVISGELRMLRRVGHITADGGTRLALGPLPRAPVGIGATNSQAKLTFRNDGGWFATNRHKSDLGLTRVRIRSGLVVKTKGGVSSVQGDVDLPEKDKLDARVSDGTLAIMGGKDPDPIPIDLSGGSTYSTGACAADDTNGCRPVATKDDPQIASVRLPQDLDADDLTVTEEPGPPKSIGKAKATVVDASRPDGGGRLSVSSGDPIVLKLRYDPKVAAGYSPSTTRVRVAAKQGDPYNVLDPCSSGQIPPGETACVDRDRSHFAPDGDLVMVVRTLHFSRYIPSS